MTEADLAERRQYFAARLKEERKRVDLSAETLAEAGGVSRATQFTYENGTGVPDVSYLLRIADKGLDVVYVLTGNRQRLTIEPCSRALLDRYEVVPQKMRDVIDGVALLASMAFSGREHYIAEVSYHVPAPTAPPTTLHEPSGRRKRST